MRSLRVSLILSALAALGASGTDIRAAGARTAIIDVTDLYHPGQDVGDNFDLVAAYALPEIDLKAVVLDITQRFRAPVAEVSEVGMRDTGGPRDPGIIPVMQLNYIFDRDVPFGMGPFTPMDSTEDKKLDAPRFQQTGVRLILDTLRASPDKIDILSFGSARPVAVAYNRDRELFRTKVRRIHLCAGASSPDYLEWNVLLDPKAMVCLLRSDLPVAIYPCATREGPFAYGPNNCFWLLPELGFIERMQPPLRSYLGFAFTRAARADFLRAMDEDFPAQVMKQVCARKHSVWETAVWMQVSNRSLVHRADGRHRIIPAGEVRPDDRVLPNALRPCKVSVNEKGLFTFRFTDEPTNLLMYDRGDPLENEKALREALPALYTSFKVK